MVMGNSQGFFRTTMPEIAQCYQVVLTIANCKKCHLSSSTHIPTLIYSSNSLCSRNMDLPCGSVLYQILQGNALLSQL